VIQNSPITGVLCRHRFFESRSFRALDGLLFALVGPSLGRTKRGFALHPFDQRFSRASKLISFILSFFGGSLDEFGLSDFIPILYSALPPKPPKIIRLQNGLRPIAQNLPRKNTTITTFHAVSKEGTGHFTDFPNFCYRGCFFVSCHSNLTETVCKTT
jgi:hypothetical protein